MTREEIIRMAREAGFSVAWPSLNVDFERFARLVAAAEREACAKEAENEHRSWPPFCGIDGGEIVANDIAKAIRARGEENEAH